MQNGNEIKIAVTLNEDTFLFKFTTSDILQDVINNICKEQRKNNTNNKFGLVFHHIPDAPHLKNKYVTDENFSEIKDGNILKLTSSIQYMLEWIFISKSHDFEDTYNKVTYLPNLCDDTGVLVEMVKCGYHNKIPLMINGQNEKYLLLCLKSLRNILDKGIKPDTIDQKFLEYITTVIKEYKCTPEVLTITIEILNQIIENHYDCLYVINTLTIKDLFPIFWDEEKSVLQKQTVSLINNMISLVDAERDNFIAELSLPRNKKYIYKYLTRNATNDTKLSHELCILQSHILSSYYPLLQERINYNNDYSDIVQLRTDEDLNDRVSMIDFEEKDVNRSRVNTYSSDSSENLLRISRSISIDNQLDDVLDSANSQIYSTLEPIILTKLTTICIDFYKKKYNKNYSTVFLQTQYYPGFYKICEQITELLCELLYISKKPNSESRLYIPLFFATDNNFFEELFCRAIWLLSKTRREMRGKVDEDHEKILAVLKEQISIALFSKPREYKALTENLKKVSHVDVFRMWEEERNSKWNDFLQNSLLLTDLKKNLESEVQQLIYDQRLNILKKGEIFPKLPEKRGRQQYWYIKLTKNNNKLQYCDFDVQTHKYTSSKTEILIKNIKHVIAGKASRPVKEHKVRKPELITRCFTILLENENGLDFLASDDTTAQYWIDGLHLLIGKSLDSEKYKKEFDMLLKMELNISLIELQNIPIPDSPPTIPSLPPECRLKPSIPPKTDQIRQSIIRRKTVNINSNINNNS